MTTEQILALLARWEENSEAALRLADNATDWRLKQAYTQRAYVWAQARVDLRRACPELQLPMNVSDFFGGSHLRSVS